MITVADELDALDVCEETAMWRALVRQLWQDALSVGDIKSSCTAEERHAARRWFLSPLHRSDRELVSTFCGYSVEKLEAHAGEVLRPIIAREAEAEAQRVETAEEREARESLADHIDAGGSLEVPRNGRLRKRPAPMLWTAAEFLQWAVANAAGLDELGELDAAIEEAARRELTERQPATPMAPTRPAMRAEPYSDIDSVPAIAAE